MSPVEKEKLLTLASFTDVMEAKIAQAMLEAEGISCVVQDENIIAMNWMFSAAVGGVKLMVRESDMAEASMLLRGEFPDGGGAGIPRRFRGHGRRRCTQMSHVRFG